MQTSGQSGEFPRLLAPLRVGVHTLRNRIIMGSMHTRLEHLDDPMRRETAFYEARAAGGVAIVITGGFSPNPAGMLEPGAPLLCESQQAYALRPISTAIRKHGALSLLQILHAGRYAKHDGIVGASSLRSPINPQIPRALSSGEVECTVDDYVRCAELACEAGFDGVEIMGSEGYLITQFTAPLTNTRSDAWGGSLPARCRFPVEVTRRIRERLGRDFLIMYRISALDLVEGGSTAAETDYLARAVEAAGADILNTGYGWHEAAVPTIAYQVPRGAWTIGAQRMKLAVGIPVVASNRINTPQLAEAILESASADLISMARPLLADPDFVAKTASGRSNEINTCIACNQSCLDHVFSNRTATCLVNPRACRETEFSAPDVDKLMRVAVVGSGPAGLAYALEASRRGHTVTLFEAQSDIGGQLNLARKIPGKQEFDELLRYFRRQLQLANVTVRLNSPAEAGSFSQKEFDHVIVATGIVPRKPTIPGIDHQMVVGYIDVLQSRVAVGRRVAIIGGGGIGHDVAEFLCENASATPERFFLEWRVDGNALDGTHGEAAAIQADKRQITILQRSPGRVGERLGKSTGWIVRNRLRRHGVRSMNGVHYERIDDRGLHLVLDGERQLLEVDTIVICAGQDSNDRLAQALRALNIPCDKIGGASVAAELDAARAIREATQLAHVLGTAAQTSIFSP